MDPVKELDAAIQTSGYRMVDGQLVYEGPEIQPLLDALHIERFGVARPTGSEIGESEADAAMGEGFSTAVKKQYEERGRRMWADFAEPIMECDEELVRIAKGMDPAIVSDILRIGYAHGAFAAMDRQQRLLRDLPEHFRRLHWPVTPFHVEQATDEKMQRSLQGLR